MIFNVWKILKIICPNQIQQILSILRVMIFHKYFIKIEDFEKKIIGFSYFNKIENV